MEGGRESDGGMDRQRPNFEPREHIASPGPWIQRHRVETTTTARSRLRRRLGLHGAVCHVPVSSQHTESLSRSAAQRCTRGGGKRTSESLSPSTGSPSTRMIRSPMSSSPFSATLGSGLRQVQPRHASEPGTRLHFTNLLPRWISEMRHSAFGSVCSSQRPTPIRPSPTGAAPCRALASADFFGCAGLPNNPPMGSKSKSAILPD